MTGRVVLHLALWITISFVMACAIFPASALDELKPDPNLTITTLDSGLNLIISPEPAAENAVLMALDIQAGAMRETDQGRGAAQIALRASLASAMRTPSGQALTDMGIRLGQEIAPALGSSRVQITLRLPADDRHLAKAIEFLRTLLDQPDIRPMLEDTRAELLNELNAFSSPARDARNELVRRVAPGSRLDSRIPLASPEFVRRVSDEDVLTFRDAHYSANNAVLYVIGDVQAERINGLAKDAFATLPSRAAAPPLLPETLDYPSRPVISVSEGVSSCTVGVISLFQPPSGMRTTEGVRKILTAELAITVLGHRLSDSAMADDAAIDQIGTLAGPIAEGIWGAQAGAAASPERWADALSEIVAQVDAIRSPASIDLGLIPAKRAVHDRILDAAQTDGSLENKLAWFRERRQYGDVLIDPSQFAEIEAQLLADIDADAVASKARQMFPRDGLAYIAEGPPSALIDADRVMNAAASPRIAWTPTAEPITHIDIDAHADTTSITELRHDPIVDVSTATLANGVVVRHRPMPDATHVVITVRLDTRMFDAPGINPALPYLAAATWDWPSTKAHTPATLARWSRLHGITTGVRVESDSILLTLRARPDDAKPAIQLAGIMCTDPALSARAFDRKARELQASLRYRDLDPRERLRRVLHNESIPHEASRQRVMTVEDIGIAEHAQTAVYTDRLARFAPLDVAIVGPIDRTTIFEQTAGAFGSLASRAPKSKRDVNGMAQSIDRHGPSGWSRTDLEGAPAGTAQIVLAIRGATSGRPDQRAEFDVLAGILNTRLVAAASAENRVARINVSSRADDAIPALDLLMITAICPPDDLNALVALIKDTLRQAANEPVRPDEAEPIIRRLSAAAGATLRDSTAWSAHMAHARLRGKTLDDNAQRAEAFSRLDTTTLHRSLANTLEQGGWIVTQK